MKYLVDGYNFAHGAGLIPDRSGLKPGELDRARDKVGGWFRGLLRGGDEVTIFWDAGGHPFGAPLSPGSGGVIHLFASGSKSADDEILAAVRDSEAPHLLCVISDDQGILRPARHRGAKILSVAGALSRLDNRAGGRRGGGKDPCDHGEEEEKPPPPTGSELDEWERIFESGEEED